MGALGYEGKNKLYHIKHGLVPVIEKNGTHLSVDFGTG